MRSYCDLSAISAIGADSVRSWGAISVKSKGAKSKAWFGLWVRQRSWRVRFEVEVEQWSRSVRSQRALGSRFAGKVKGCNLGVIRSRSQMVKSKGAKSKGSGLLVRGVIWVRSLSLFARESENGLKWKFSLQTISGSNQLKHTINWKAFPKNLFSMRNQTPAFTEKAFPEVIWSQNKHSLKVHGMEVFCSKFFFFFYWYDRILTYDTCFMMISLYHLVKH